MNFSYWERKTWLTDVDFAIIGSGIVGLTCALTLREKHPKANIVVLERGILPSGASTKNAGFACFGSISEILEDLAHHSEAEVIQLVEARVDGLKRLRSFVGDKTLDYQEHGGYELFSEKDSELYSECSSKISYVNQLLKPVFGTDVFTERKNSFGFGNIHSNLIYNRFEGQIDTGKMMFGLLQKASEANIKILNSVEITGISKGNESAMLSTNISEEISAKNVFIATNGFAKQFLSLDVVPARAQVLITKPIANLPLEGTFHLDKGYYYFRNIHDRVLFGGGRNLDFKTEETTQMGLTELVQDQLEEVLRTTILPNTPFEIDMRWSGIMGVGQQKKPIVKEVMPRVYCGVRLGGMGVAIGSTIGKELAHLID